ncbi:hypothetical protein GGF31_006785 [Allomyces arbusculus]|nr:hypothetical protein GGF31_006785 [Allomyces arbusculus]
MPPAAASAAATAPPAVRSTTSRRPRAAPAAAATLSRSSSTASLPARARTAAAAAPARTRLASTTPTAPGSAQKTVSASSPLARGVTRTPPSRPTSAPVTLPAAAVATAKDAATPGASRHATPAATAKAARREEDLSISHRTLTALNEDLAATVRQQADTIALLQSHVAKLERQIALPAPTAPIVESEVDLDGDAADADHTPDDGCTDGDEPAVFDHSLVLGRMCVRAERMLRAAQQALIACAPPVPLDPMLDDPPPAPRIRAPSVVTSTTSSARLRASPRPSLVVAPADAPRVKLAPSSSSRSSIQSTDSGIASTTSPGPDAQVFPVATAASVAASASTASPAAASQRHLQTLLKSLAYHVHLLGTPAAAPAAASVLPDRRASGRKDSVVSTTPPPRSRSPVAVTRSGESIVSAASTATAARRSLGLLGVLGGFAARSRTTSMTAASVTGGGGASGSAVSSAPPASRHGLGLVLDLQEQREEALAAPAPPAQDGAIVTQCKDLVLELCRAAGVEMKEVAEMLVDLDPDAAYAARRPSGAASTLSSRVQGAASDRGSVILAPPPPHAAPPPMDCDVMFPPRTGKPRLAAAAETGINDNDDNAESMTSELSLFDDLRSNASSTRSNYSGFTYLPQQKQKQKQPSRMPARRAAGKDSATTKSKRTAPPSPPLRRPSATGSTVPDRPASVISTASHPRVVVTANSPPPSDAPTTPTSTAAPRGSRRSLLVADASSAVSGGSSTAAPPHHAPRSPRALGGLVGSWVGRAGAAAAAAGRSKRGASHGDGASAASASRSATTAEATVPAPAPRVVKVKSWVA